MGSRPASGSAAGGVAPAVAGAAAAARRARRRGRLMRISSARKYDPITNAMAATCAADQNKFWEFHHRVFKKEADEGQLSNERLNKGHLSDENLRKIAEESGLDMAAYEACLADPATQEKVANQQREATELGISSTPTFLFNGRPLGGTPVNLDAWRQILDEQIAAAQATPEATGTAEATATATAGQ